MSHSADDFAAIVAALELYQASALHTMTAAHGLNRADTPRKADAVAALGRRLAMGDGVADLIAHLTSAQVTALQALVGREASMALLSLRTLMRRLVTPSAEADRELRELLRLGLMLFDGMGNSWKLDLSEHDPTMSTRFVWSPAAVQAALPPPLPWQQVVLAAPEPESAQTGDPGALLRDLFLLLRSVRARPLRLTRQHTIHQGDLKRLISEMRPHVSGNSWQGMAGELPFLLGVAIGAGLLAGDEQQLTADASIDAFLQATRAQQVETLLRAWLVLAWSELDRVPGLRLDAYAGPYTDVPGIEQLARARETIVDALRALVDAGWWSVDSLADAIRRREPEFVIGGNRAPMFLSWGYWPQSRGGEATHYSGIRRADTQDYQQSLLDKATDWDLVEGAYLRQVLLDPLCWLGIVDVGVDATDRVVTARVAPLGRQMLLGTTTGAEVARGGASLIVQPNFEIVVLDAGASLSLLARLDEFATAKSVDRAAIYQLTRESAVAALQRGVRLADIEQLLERESGAPLPQNVQYSLTEWARQFERVALRGGVVLLEADSTAQLDAWLRDTQVAPHLGRRLSATVVEVAAGRAEAIEARLAKSAGWRSEAAGPPAGGALTVAGDATLVLRAAADNRWERHRLLTIAELDTDPQRRRTFHLTATSLDAARSQGWTAAQVLAYLERRLGQPAPAELVLRVRGWMADLGSAQQATVRLVRLPDAALWRVVEPVAGAGLVRRVAPTMLLVDEAGLAAVSIALSGYGVTVQAAVPETIVAAWPAGETTAAVDLQPLRGKALRSFLDTAIAGKQQVIIQHHAANQKAPRRYTVKPKWVEHRMAGYYLVAVTETGAERAFKLDDVFGVAVEEGT